MPKLMFADSSALRSLRRQIAEAESQLDKLRAKELRAMAQAAKQASAKAAAKGDKEQAGFLAEQATAFSEDAAQLEELAGLKAKLRQARIAGDGAKAEALMSQARQAEERAHKHHMGRGLQMHEGMLRQLRAHMAVDLEHLDEEASLAKDKDAKKALLQRKDAGREAMALVDELGKDTQAIKEAQAKGDAEALARLLRIAEEKKQRLGGLMEKFMGPLPEQGEVPSPGPGGPGMMPSMGGSGSPEGFPGR